MEQQERRAALSAFFWTITVMAIAGGILFWQADAIPTVPVAQANDGAVSQYTASLALANKRSMGYTPVGTCRVALDWSRVSSVGFLPSQV